MANPGAQETPATFVLAANAIRNNKKKIEDMWEARVRKKVPVAESQTSLSLQNAMGTFIDELAESLEKGTITSTLDFKKGMSKLHGSERAGFSGYFLPQLLKEFSILREVLGEALQTEGLLTYPAGLVLNSAIDAAISSASSEFALVQQDHIKAALNNAEASNRDLENFASVAAHDLKSPLATISGYLDLLQDESGSALTPEILQYVATIQRAANRMRSLIDSLLEYARLTNSPKPFYKVDLQAVLKGVLHNLEAAINSSQAKIEYDKLPLVMGDENLLTQLLQNLIANSIKFSGDLTPKIQISVEDLTPLGGGLNANVMFPPTLASPEVSWVHQPESP